MSGFEIDSSEVKAFASQLPTGAEIAREEVKTALYTSGLTVEGKAKGIVHYITRALQRSIHTTEPQIDNSGGFVTVGPSIVYGPVEEYGNAYRPGHPYMQPALQQSEAMIQQAFEDAGSRIVERLARK